MTEHGRVDAGAASEIGAGETGEAIHAGIGAPVLVTLAMLSAVAPFAIDLYLPALPQMAIALKTSEAGVQLSLTAFLIGAALGQLFFGPLSDRYGRVRPVVLGSLVCALAGAAAALSPNIAFLVAARFVQGAAGSAGMVIGRAIVSDLAEDKNQAARAFNLLLAVVGIAPVVAPWVGSLIVGPLGWRGTLWVVCGFTVLVLVAVLAFLRESHTPARRARARAQQASRHAGLRSLVSRRFLGNTLAFAFPFTAYMGYISASPFIFQVIVGLSVVQYGLLFALIALVLTGVSALAAHLNPRIAPRRQLRFGLLALLAGSAALSAILVFKAPPVWTILPIAVAVSSLGFIMGNATSAAIAAVPQAAGTGSAVLGALQFGFGALVAPLVGLRGEHSASPLATVMIVASGLSFAAFLLAGREMPEVKPATNDAASTFDRV
jgi:DHA1 family bicyclomycin/chloramphenicol resistance-like MFS transporter